MPSGIQDPFIDLPQERRLIPNIGFCQGLVAAFAEYFGEPGARIGQSKTLHQPLNCPRLATSFMSLKEIFHKMFKAGLGIRIGRNGRGGGLPCIGPSGDAG